MKDDKKKKPTQKKSTKRPVKSEAKKNKEKLANEVYDLLITKYDPSKVKAIPSRRSFINTNVNGTVSMQDLKKRKEELQKDLGINPNKEKSKTTKKPTAKKVMVKNSTAASSKKPAKKTDSKAKFPKHSDKEEMKVGKERPIIINRKAKAQKQSEAAQPSKAAVTSRVGRVSSVTYHIKYD